MGALGGGVFHFLHLPLPWTLGPLFIIAALRLAFNKRIFWSSGITNGAMVILGYLMGRPFTPQIVGKIIEQLPLVAFMTTIVITLCLLVGYAVSRQTGVGLANSLLGSMPGGLAQIVILAKDVNGADSSTVTLMQTIRLMTVVFVIPFAVVNGVTDSVIPATKAASAGSISDIPALLAFAAVIFAVMAALKRFDTAGLYVTAPVLITAMLVVGGLEAPPLPLEIIAIAQICVGIKMGAGIDIDSLTNWKKILLLNLAGVLVVILVLAGISYLVSQLYAVPFATIFISAAPGGITEMMLTAMAVDADLPTVLSFQLVRLILILLVGVPVIRWWLRRRLTGMSF